MGGGAQSATICLETPMPVSCVDSWDYRQVSVYESRGARQVHNKQSNTNQDNTFFQRKKELPWVGLKPTTLCFLDRVLLYVHRYQCVSS